jgi:8-oxo-dGTP diphosphatase
LKVPAPEKATPVAVAALFSPRGLLLIRREKPPFAGLWGMPGGKVHRGEHLDEAVEREVREESGLDAKFQRLCGVVTELLYEGRTLSMHYLLLVCRLYSRSVTLTRSAEGEVRWFPVSSLRRHWDAVIPSDRLMLEKFVLRRPTKLFYRCTVRQRGEDYRVEKFD